MTPGQNDQDAPKGQLHVPSAGMRNGVDHENPNMSQQIGVLPQQDLVRAVQKIGPPSHPTGILAKAMNQNGIICARERQFGLAIDFFKTTLTVVESLVPSEPCHFTDVLENIGYVHGKYESALDLFHRGRQIKRRVLAANDSR